MTGLPGKADENEDIWINAAKEYVKKRFCQNLTLLSWQELDFDNKECRVTCTNGFLPREQSFYSRQDFEKWEIVSAYHKPTCSNKRNEKVVLVEVKFIHSSVDVNRTTYRGAVWANRREDKQREFFTCYLNLITTGICSFMTV